MSSYLYTKFKGQYRVIADYDQSTLDFPRIEQIKDGEIKMGIDPSFDDYYIPSIKFKLEIRHSYRDNLMCYCKSLQQMFNIGYRICKEQCNKKYERTSQNNTRVFETLLDNNLITDYDLMDGEGTFHFKTDKMPVLATYLGLKTNGANISPLSKKNLPKNDYKIPSIEDEKYKEIIHKKELKMHEIGRIVKIANKTFEETLQKKQIKEMKELGMNHKQYASYSGLWHEYLTIVEKTVDKYGE